MNVYFLVEGKRCERKLYPMWLSLAAPHLTQVSNLAQVTENTYFLISGEGYPSILDIHLPNAIRDVESIKKFDVLVVVLDAEEHSIQDRIDQVVLAVTKSSKKLNSADFEIVVQNRCIETWLLGNRKIFVRQPQDSELRQYAAYYDVQKNDPEFMPYPSNFTNHAQFHLAYLKSIFRERGIAYTKTNPRYAGEKHFFDQLIKRVTDSPDHLKTFSQFLRLCESF